MKTIEEAALEYAEHEANDFPSGDCRADMNLCEIEDWFKDAFKAGAEFAQRWISVDEKLPEIDESGESDLILMKIDHFVYVGNYNEDGEWVELITREKYTPTHWRQIDIK